MGPLELEDVKEVDFALRCSLEGLGIVVRLSGNADLRAQEHLRSFAPKVHREAGRFNVEEVIVDFGELEFMNSSCFKAFVTWVNLVQEAPSDSRYRIRFRSNAKHHWQRRSLNALRCFGVDIVTIEPIAPA